MLRLGHVRAAERWHSSGALSHAPFARPPELARYVRILAGPCGGGEERRQGAALARPCESAYSPSPLDESSRNLALADRSPRNLTLAA